MNDVWKEARTIAFQTAKEWLEDGVPGRGAALSYYVLLSLGPLLVLVVGALEVFLAGDAVRSRVIDAITRGVGPGPGQTVATVLERVDAPPLLSPESFLTVAVLLFGATAVFANIRGSLNAIWGVEPEAASKMEMVLGTLRTRWRAFLMVAAAGIVIALSFAVTWLAGSLETLIRASTGNGAFLIRTLDVAVSILLSSFLFGAIYRTLPEVRIRWGSVWVGAFATSVFFVAGKVVVARLISTAEWTSYYGPGASVVAFLAWIYFSAQIFFLGAEFTQVWSRRRGGVNWPSSSPEQAT